MQDLVKLNTPRAVETETRRALRQLLQKNDKGIEPAIHNLAKLKGVGPATASGEMALFSYYLTVLKGISTMLPEMLNNMQYSIPIAPIKKRFIPVRSLTLLSVAQP